MEDLDRPGSTWTRSIKKQAKNWERRLSGRLKYHLTNIPYGKKERRLISNVTTKNLTPHVAKAHRFNLMIEASDFLPLFLPNV